MLRKNNDREWLNWACPGLVVNDDQATEVRGTIKFSGVYDKTGSFRIIYNQTKTPPSGIVLSGKYNVVIKKNPDSSLLPKLYIDTSQVKPSVNRHINPHDSTACVAGVVEEAEFMAEGFEFPRYIEELVIPFLYGQKYLDQYGEWPWFQYSHDTVGILESYYFKGSSSTVELVLKRLKVRADWERIQSLLKRRGFIKGHIPCFCPIGDHIKRCHPNALKGARKLKEDIIKIGISVK